MQTSASTYVRDVFVGKSRVKAATSMVISFNEGASAILTVMERLWLQTTVVTADVMRETDMLRMSKAEAITSATVKRRRKSLSTVKKLKRYQQEMDERPTNGANMGQLCCKQAWVGSMCYARRTYCLLVQFGGSLCSVENYTCCVIYFLFVLDVLYCC